MKKYLIKITVIYILTSFFNVLASDSSLYKEFFMNAGVSVHEIRDNIEEKDRNFSKKELENKPYLLFITSENKNNSLIDKLDDLINKNIFIICNSSYVENNLFKCSSNSIEFKNSIEEVKKLNFISTEGNNLDIYYKNINGNQFFFIIENELFSLSQQMIFKDYLISLKKSQEVSLNDNYYFEKVDYFKLISASFSFELFTYIVFTVFLLSITLNLINYFLKNYNNKLEISEFIKLVKSSFFGFFNRNIYSKILFLIIIFFYIVTFYIFIYYDLTSESSKIQRNLILSAFYSISTIYLVSFISVIFLISRIEFFQFIFQKTRERYSKLSFKYPELTLLITFYLFLISYVINIFIEITQITIIFLLILIFSYVKFLSVKSHLSKFFKLKNKIIISFISFLPIILYVFLSNFEIPKKFSYEDLINVSDSIVSLPYKKDIGPDTLIKKEDLNFNSSVFIDNILIYHPIFNIVKNYNVKNFKSKDHNFIFSAKNKELIIKEILNNPNIIKYFDTKSFSLFNLLSNKDNQALKVKITVNCNKVTKKDFNIKIYNYDFYDDFKTRELALGHLLSCNSDSKDYLFNLPSEYIGVQNLIIEIDKSNQIYLKSFEILQSDSNLLALSPFDIHENNLFPYIYNLKNTKINKEELINYYLINEENTFKKEDSVFDSINNLILNNYIDSEFYIWSLDDVVLIKNNYQKLAN